MENYLMNTLVLLKRIGNLYNEVLDVTKQMAEAVDRNDQVSVQMLVAMRQEPLEKLQMADQALREHLAELPDPEESQRLASVIDGKTAPMDGEQMLADQASANARRLKQVVELDKVLNHRLTREKSVYGKNR